jgi:hypothetical protein
MPCGGEQGPARRDNQPGQEQKPGRAMRAEPWSHIGDPLPVPVRQDRWCQQDSIASIASIATSRHTEQSSHPAAIQALRLIRLAAWSAQKG